MPIVIRRLVLLASLLVVSSVLARAQETTQKIDAGGLKLRARIEGPVQAGRPSVVFVSGLGGGLEDWSQVQTAVVRFARTVSYDRAGLGQSEPDNAPPTPQRIATQLHTLLQNAGIKPPYVLVGHSIGGAYVRMFAGLYPDEVAGLVYVDPSDFTQTRTDQLAIWNELGMGEAGLNEFEKGWQQYASAPPAVRAEAEVAEQLNKNGWTDFRSLAPLPDVPVVILMATKFDIPPVVKAVMGRQRLEHLAKWTQEVSDGTLVLTGRSGHQIQHSEPDLVTWAIQRALGPAPRPTPAPTLR